MKKRLSAFAAFILACLIAVTGFAGCRLITKNNERDMSQVVATVSVNTEENIYKKDVVMAYMNYGYMYANYYGYSAEKVYTLLLKNLVENRIMVQAVMQQFEDEVCAVVI